MRLFESCSGERGAGRAGDKTRDFGKILSEGNMDLKITF